MNNPLVYLIVLTWNQKQDTLVCLASLSRATYSCFRIVLVDNGSADGTPEEVREKFPEVHVIRNNKNLGFTGGNIKGAEYACAQGADYIMLLNNDVEVAPDFLERLIEVAESDAKIGAIGPVIYFFEPRDRVQSAGCHRKWLGLNNQKLFYGKTDEKIPELLESDMVTGAALCVKRKVIEEVGFLDDIYFAYNEDVDLCYRIRQAGYRIVTVKASRIWHKVSASTGGLRNPVNQYLMARGHSIFIRKFGRWWEKVIFFPLAFAATTVVLVREIIKGNAHAILPKYQGYIDGWLANSIDAEKLSAIKAKYTKRSENTGSQL